MKSILIVGASNAGKSTTVREVCKRLNPNKVYRLYADTTNLENSRIEPSEIEAIFNDTFIVEYLEKWILVVAGAPTEQNIKITVLMDICIQIGIDISLSLVSMRSFERREGFDTLSELGDRTEMILTKRIHKIDGDKFMNGVEWNERIDEIVNAIKDNV